MYSAQMIDSCLSVSTAMPSWDHLFCCTSSSRVHLLQTLCQRFCPLCCKYCWKWVQFLFWGCQLSLNFVDSLLKLSKFWWHHLIVSVLSSGRM